MYPYSFEKFHSPSYSVALNPILYMARRNKEGFLPLTHACLPTAPAYVTAEGTFLLTYNTS